MFCKKKTLPAHIGPNIDSKSTVLFIHGLAGGNLTWYKFSNHLNRKWSENNELDSFSLEYDDYYLRSRKFILKYILNARNIIKGVDIYSLAKHLKTVIDQNCSESENVIIVAHSMGGLVARQYIVDRLRKEKNLGKLKCLITYATPHKGSKVATYTNPFFDLWKHRINPIRWFTSKQVYQLGFDSQFIDDLNRSWRDLNVNDKIDFKRVVGGMDWVVNVVSATMENDSNVSYLANKDHFNIIKPDEIGKDTAFLVTYNYLKNFNLKIEKEKEYDESYNQFINEEDDE